MRCGRRWAIAETLLEDLPFPQADPAALVRDAVTLAVQVNGKLRGTIEVAGRRRARTRSSALALAEPHVAQVPRGPDGAQGDRGARQDRQHRRRLTAARCTQRLAGAADLVQTAPMIESP